MIRRAWIALAIAVAAGPALGAECSRAATAVERAICGDAALGSADTALNRLYVQLRGRATPAARAALVSGQRAWLAKRDATCRTGARACLMANYAARLDQLRALEAVSQDDRLDQTVPVILRGSWKVGTLVPAKGHVLPPDVDAQLTAQRLPRPGETMQAGPARLCISSIGCDDIGWSATTLAEVEGGSRYADDFGLPPTAQVLKGVNGTPRVDYTLLARPGGQWMLLAYVCTDAYRAEGCANAYELLTPASPDTRVQIGDRN